MIHLELSHLWTAEGWLSPAFVDIDSAGNVVAVRRERANGTVTETVTGYTLPGMPNLHSHAFQRGMAGLAEHRRGEDSFWTWRDAMYRSVERLDPDAIFAIAAWLYAEMLEAGYTAVGEFHYLHHAVDGRPYARRAELSDRIIEAARRSGIGLTLLPVLYASSGFDGAPPEPGQRRFANDVDGLLQIVEQARALADGDDVRVGVAPHSLRAVPAPELARCIAGARALDASAPIHIHVAEQQREVDQCLQARGARPVQWLADNVALDQHWCLVHATWIDAAEVAAVARSAAVVGLCPTTEANLGDGVAPAERLLAQGVPFGIGSDSHISVSVIEELRWLEYAQRLTGTRRNVLASAAEPSTATRLYAHSLNGGARALGRAIGAIEPGARADLVVLDEAHPALVERPLERILDCALFAASSSPVRDVMVGGQWRVRDGRHRERDALLAGYRRAVRQLRSGG